MPVENAMSEFDAVGALEEMEQNDEEQLDEELPENEADDDASDDGVDGDNDGEELEEESPQIQDELEEVEYEGKKYSVPKELSKGLMLHRDYTHKTQQLAEQRRAIEEHAQAIQQERHVYANQLVGLIQQIDATIQPDVNTDWEALARTDPVAYVQRKAQFDKYLLMRQQAQEAQAELHELNQIDAQRQLSEHIQRNREALPTLIKEWANPDVAKKERAAVKEYLLANGFEQGEVAQAYDARQIAIARKAMLFDQMMSKRTKPASPTPPKVIKPGASQHTNSRKQLDKNLVKNFKKSRSDRDAVALLNAMED